MNYKLELIKFYESDRLNDMIYKICQNGRHRDDLKQELILYLLEMNEDKLIDLINKKQLLFYSYGYLTNQYHSSTSEFFKLNRNYTNLSNSFDVSDYVVDDDRYLKVEKFLNTKVNWFDAFLFRSFYYNSWSDEKQEVVKGLSYRKIENKYTLSKDMKIDHMFIWQSVTKTTNLLKKELGI